MKLTLGELEAAAGTGLAVLLAFDHAAVSCQESTFAEDGVMGRIAGLKGTGNSQNHSSGLSGGASPLDCHGDVHLPKGICRMKGSEDHGTIAFDREIVFQRTTVHGDTSAAFLDADSGNRCLATTGSPCDPKTVDLTAN